MLCADPACRCSWVRQTSLIASTVYCNAYSLGLPDTRGLDTVVSASQVECGGVQYLATDVLSSAVTATASPAATPCRVQKTRLGEIRTGTTALQGHKRGTSWIRQTEEISSPVH
jgi:hypothetical protein